MKTILLPLILLITLGTSAQSAKEIGLNTINRKSAEVHIEFLASDALEGREAGKNGSKIASEYIKAMLQEIGIKPLNNSYFQEFEAYSKERQKRVRFSVHPDSIAKYKKEAAHRKLEMRNVLGYIEGENKDEFAIIGAHFDHLGIDEALVNDKIYNGADDNASGVSAVLQIAKAFVKSGKKPKRSIIFAFWDGEELGLLGSEFFMLNFPNSSQIKSYLNFDMIGRNNDESKPNHVVYFYTEANKAFGEWLKNDIKKYNLDLAPDYRPWDKPIGGSDNSSFAKREVPIIWYHTDGHPDYHQPSDHADKINWSKLVNITKAAYLNLWNMANIDDY
ncbi:M20/M25/M40 family metallo-hydrolase [Dysgonomonas sp. Marseille-P4361]|uniref:M20/M25/M40 family metallo-hydrolase n=1 Tax=Dysgonomonas sp. Marseille-P4361 TaxID=2161820 RepID=UPI000D556BD7|nr:M20/M25/M40 family metallo-hydrolase [Dysgonomonas sp. Marseille-P4361]